MKGDRWRVAGIASPRSRWFSELARWSTAAAIPVDFVKCVSAAEMRSRFAHGEIYSALLIDGDIGDLSRALVSEAADHSTAAVIVGKLAEEQRERLGAAAQLPEDFSREDLIVLLEAHAAPLGRTEDVGAVTSCDRSSLAANWQGTLISVTGAGGTGASLLAMALAQGFAADASNRGLVLLADLALHADQAVMHDSRKIIPGLQELVESCHAGWPGQDRLAHLFFEPDGRGYQLLLGLRRHRDWISLRRRLLEIALTGLTRTYRYVVVDTESDLEGQAETGSSGIEDRNRMARMAIERSEIVVVVGAGDLLSMHSLVRTIVSFAERGICCDRLLPVINRSSHNLRSRSAAASALEQLLENTAAKGVGRPLFVPVHRGVEPALRDGVALPASLGRILAAAVAEKLQRQGSK